MAEKKEGFGQAPAQAERLNVVFETPDYRVVLGRLSSGPEGTAPELLVRYIIQHKKHGIIYGTASGLGQAIAHTVQAQVELQNATDASQEYAARSYKLEKKQEEQTGNGLSIPRFQ
jgi:hypothetical protein